MLLAIIGSSILAGIVGWLAIEADYDLPGVLIWLIAVWACVTAIMLGAF